MFDFFGNVKYLFFVITGAAQKSVLTTNNSQKKKEYIYQKSYQFLEFVFLKYYLFKYWFLLSILFEDSLQCIFVFLLFAFALKVN